MKKLPPEIDKEGCYLQCISPSSPGTASYSSAKNHGGPAAPALDVPCIPFPKYFRIINSHLSMHHTFERSCESHVAMAWWRTISARNVSKDPQGTMCDEQFDFFEFFPPSVLPSLLSFPFLSSVIVHCT